MNPVWGRRLALATTLALLAVAAGCGDNTGGGQVAVTENNDPNNDVPNNDVNNDTPNNDPNNDIPIIDENNDDNNNDFVPACSLEDGVAPNQTPEEAADLGNNVDRDDLYICPLANDWYRFELEAGQGMLFFVEFQAQFGDLDIYLYEEGRTDRPEALAESTSPNQSEFIQFEAPTSGTYLLEIEGFEGAENQYRLFARLTCGSDADCPGDSACNLRGGFCVDNEAPDCGADDGFEPNESGSTATRLDLDGGQASVEELSICPEDSDYFRVTVPDASGLLIELDHPAREDVDVLLFNDEGRFFGQGTQRNGGETLRALFLPAGDYLVLVDQIADDAARPTTYDLSVSIEAGVCTTDVECAGVPGREFCDTDSGTCQGIDGQGQVPLGQPCDGDNDCVGEADGCYEGTEGGGDNICTVLCQEDADCGDEFGPGAYCLLIDNFRQTRICVPGCEEDFDCSFQLFCSPESGQCESRACGVDEDCPRENEDCVYGDTEQVGLCLEYERFQNPTCGQGEGPDALDNGSSSRASLIELGTEGTFIEGLSICDEDEDWYVVELTGDATNLTVDVEFDGRADLDVYILTAEGDFVGAGTAPDANPEQALGVFLEAGVYYLRVNKFPSQDGDPTVDYALSINTGSVDCRGDETACDDTFPLRISCDEQTGSCLDFEGEGQVPLGELCDSNDDCVEGADFCFTFQGGGGQNICTHFCTAGAQCNDVPGTQCVAIRRGLGICIPN